MYCWHAASTWDRGLWEEILNDPVLLAKCTAKHAGRVALQLFATWVCDKYRPNEGAKDQIAKTWCGECQICADLAKLHISQAPRQIT